MLSPKKLSLKNKIAFICLSLSSASAFAVVGGLPATGKNWSFLRMVEFESTDDTIGGCTASMLPNGMALTAAHCVVDEHNVARTSVTLSTAGRKSTYKVYAASVVSSFTGAPGRFDIAMIYTDSAASQAGTAAVPQLITFNGYHQRNPNDSFSHYLSTLDMQDIRNIIENKISRDQDGTLRSFLPVLD